ncbi:MAG TPA: response regulator [Steroidobacteraceae bacterium]|nr:response regulator [Steroidobacteraceae bacterium]
MNSADKANILIVDDEEKSLYALGALLERSGENLLLARSGDEALRAALEHDLALILLDVRMPGMDGFETAALIRARERSQLTPIIFLTGATDELGAMFRGYSVGAVDYLFKPVVPEVLKSKVSIFVDLHRKNAELAREIAERKEAERRLRESEEKLRALAARLITVREEDRAHMAREIHDELGQVLTALKMEGAWLASQLTDARLVEKTQSMLSLVDATIHTVRKICTGLRPEVLDEMGLVAAIDWQATEFQKRTGVRCRVRLPADGVDFNEDLSTTTFRIFQEILTNVTRHSRATRVDVELEQVDGRLEMRVTDNGIGIADGTSSARTSLGLLGMQERALRLGGSVHVDGNQGRGTAVAVSIPIARP